MVGFTWRDGVRPPQDPGPVPHQGRLDPVAAGPAAARPARPGVRRGDRQGRHHPGRRPSRPIRPTASRCGWPGRVPPELGITLIHADRLAGDERLARRRRTSRSTLAARPRAAVAVPTIYTRAQWGADESWRDGSPRYNSTILQAHVHHTATGNGYAQADVPALIRSMYKYHTHSLGWSDIAYNFLIDNYGTIWEGRYGGMDQPVRGAHTLGFNNSSTGFSMIGNYDSVQPSSATLGLAGAARRLEAVDVRPRPAGLDPGQVRGQRQVPQRARWSRCRSSTGTATPTTPPARAATSTPSSATCARPTAGVIAASTLKLKTPFDVTRQAPSLGRTLTVADGKFKPKDGRGHLPVDAQRRRDRRRRRLVVRRDRGRRRPDRSAWSSPAACPASRRSARASPCPTPCRSVPGLLGAHPAQAGRQGDRALRGRRARASPSRTAPS